MYVCMYILNHCHITQFTITRTPFIRRMENKVIVTVNLILF